MLNYLYLIILVGLFLLTFGYLAKQKLFYGFGSIILMFAGLTVVQSGLGNYTNETTQYFGVILIILGAIFPTKEVIDEVDRWGL